MSSFSLHTQAKTNHHEDGFDSSYTNYSSRFYLSDNRSQAAVQRKENGFIDNRQQSRIKTTVQFQKNNTGLPDSLKSGIENLSGYSMDDVKVHYNSSQPAQLNAHAYAQGTDIHIAPGQEKHLAHEAWHVVQQKQGRVKPTMQMKGKINANDDKELENEADVMGKKADSHLGVVQRKLNTSNFFSGIVQRVTKIKYFPRDFDYVNKGAPEKEVVGIKMEADLDPQDPIKGSEPGDGVQFGIMSSLKNSGIKRMIRGHLMNGQMGGLGIAANLFPITAHANSKHKSYMENYVKGQLYEEKKNPLQRHIYYNVQVVPQSKPHAAGWSSIDVDFVCHANNGKGGGWQRNITIQSRPTTDVKNKGSEGGPSKNPDLKGKAEGKSPAPWGQAGDGYDEKDTDHQDSIKRSEFDISGHKVKPDLSLYTHGMHFNKGDIDADKLKAFEEFWKLEAKVGNVKLQFKGKVVTESDIEKMGSADLQLLTLLLKKELDSKPKVSKNMMQKAIEYSKANPEKTEIAIASAGAIGLTMLASSWLLSGGITLGASAVAWYLHKNGYI